MAAGTFGVFLMSVAVFVAVRIIARWQWRLKALAVGLTAEGRVLEVAWEPGDQGREAIARTVVGFHAEDGREFRIEDVTGSPRLLGERVQVRYLADHPEWALIDARGPGTGGTLLVLLCCAVVALAGIGCLAICLKLITYQCPGCD